MTDTHELLTVAGTTFRLPVPPDDDTSPQATAKRKTYERVTERAPKIKPPRKWSPPKQSKPPKPGDGFFEPKPGDPGSYLEGFEVWALAPRHHRWVIDGDGYRLMHVSGRDAGGDVGPGDSRRLIVGEMQQRRKEVVADRLVPRGNVGRGLSWDEVFEERRLRTLALNWACEVIAHELYPDHYPEPEVPSDLREKAA